MSGTVGLLGLSVCMCVCVRVLHYVSHYVSHRTNHVFLIHYAAQLHLWLAACVCFAVIMFCCLSEKASTFPAGVNTATAPSAFPPTCNVTSATSTTRKSPSSATCVIVASANKPTWTVTSRSTRTATCQVRSPERTLLICDIVSRCIYKSFCWII